MKTLQAQSASLPPPLMPHVLQYAQSVRFLMFLKAVSDKVYCNHGGALKFLCLQEIQMVCLSVCCGRAQPLKPTACYFPCWDSSFPLWNLDGAGTNFCKCRLAATAGTRYSEGHCILSSTCHHNVLQGAFQTCVLGHLLGQV